MSNWIIIFEEMNKKHRWTCSLFNGHQYCTRKNPGMLLYWLGSSPAGNLWFFLGGKEPRRQKSPFYGSGTSRPHCRAGVVARWKFQDVTEVAFRVQRGTGEVSKHGFKWQASQGTCSTDLGSKHMNEVQGNFGLFIVHTWIIVRFRHPGKGFWKCFFLSPKKHLNTFSYWGWSKPMF